MFGRTFMLKVYSRTLIHQKSGSKAPLLDCIDPYAERATDSNNLKNTSCAALASQQIYRCVPFWLEIGCFQKLLMWQGLNWVAEGATRYVAPLCITPYPFLIYSAFAPSWLFTPNAANLPTKHFGTL